MSARQHGKVIYYQTISFQRLEEGLEHQDAMPEVGGPETGASLFDLMRERGAEDAAALGKEWAAMDVRFLGNSRYGLEKDPDHPSRARVWIRIDGKLSDDPVEHLALFTYASDVSLLGAALAAHEADPTNTQMASLDHTIWFHRPFRADEWWLYDQWSPSANGARGLSLGRVFTDDGTLVATVAQEGLIRPAFGGRVAASDEGASGVSRPRGWSRTPARSSLAAGYSTNETVAPARCGAPLEGLLSENA